MRERADADARARADADTRERARDADPSPARSPVPRSRAPDRAQIRAALNLGAVGSYCIAAGWGIVLLAVILALATPRATFVDNVLGSLGIFGIFGAILWISGALVQTPGWLALRLTRGGHARAVAVFAVVLGAAYLATFLLAIWGVPFLYLPAIVLTAAWHVLAASWFWRHHRRIALLHASAAACIALASLGGSLRAPSLLAVGVMLAAPSAIAAYILAARYMLRIRPFENVEAIFE